MVWMVWKVYPMDRYVRHMVIITIEWPHEDDCSKSDVDTRYVFITAIGTDRINRLDNRRSVCVNGYVGRDGREDDAAADADVWMFMEGGDGDIWAVFILIAMTVAISPAFERIAA